MSSIKNKTLTVSEGSRSLLREQILNLKTAQEALLYKLQSRRNYDPDVATCPSIDFSKESQIQYVPGVHLSDITTDEQNKLGVSIIHATIDETTNSPLHLHEMRCQVIFVKKGSVVDVVSEKEYLSGETFCIGKKTEHSICYNKGSEIILISIPGLDIINNIQELIK